MNTELRTLTDSEIDSVAGGFFNKAISVQVAPVIQVAANTAVALFGGNALAASSQLAISKPINAAVAL